MSSWANKDIPKRKGFALFNFNILPVVVAQVPPPPPAPYIPKSYDFPPTKPKPSQASYDIIKSESKSSTLATQSATSSTLSNTLSNSSTLTSKPRDFSGTQLKPYDATKASLVTSKLISEKTNDSYFETKILDFFKINPVVQKAIESYIESKFLDVFKLNKSIHTAIEQYMETQILNYLKEHPAAQNAVETYIENKIEERLKTRLESLNIPATSTVISESIESLVESQPVAAPVAAEVAAEVAAPVAAAVVVPETNKEEDDNFGEWEPDEIEEVVVNKVEQPEVSTNNVEQPEVSTNNVEQPEVSTNTPEKVNESSNSVTNTTPSDKVEEAPSEIIPVATNVNELDENINKLIKADIFNTEEELLKIIIQNLPEDTLQIFYDVIEQKENPPKVELIRQKTINKKHGKGFFVVEPKASAYELKVNNQTVVFVILRNIINVNDNKLWTACYNSIRKFYLNKIIIIDDNSTAAIYDPDLYNTEIIRSEFPGAAEILPYYYFFRNKWADKMVFLQDSMFLDKPLDIEHLKSDFKFHWSFKSNNFDDKYKILLYLTLMKNNNELMTFFNTNNDWLGCFGATGICSLEKLRYLNHKYDFLSVLKLVIKNRKDREAFERVLGIILFKEGLVTMENCSCYGDITKYPYAFEQTHNLSIESALHNVHSTNYKTAIIKMWRGR